MDGMVKHRRSLGKLARGLYVLAGLKLLFTAFLVTLGYAEPLLVADPAVLLLLVAAIHTKASRSGAAALIAFCLWNVADYLISMNQGQQLFVATFAYADEALWLLLALDSFIAFAAILCAVEAIHFHRLAGTRVIWRNAVIVTVSVVAYGVFLFVFVVLLSDIVLSQGARDLVATATLGVVVALAIWRKLPGVRGVRIVLDPSGDVETMPAGGFADTMNQLFLASLVQGEEDGGHVVSPIGLFGKSYRLTDEQFASYVAKHRGRMKRDASMWYLFLPVLLLVSLAGPLGFDRLNEAVLPVMAVAAAIVAALSLWKQKQAFLREFPGAPVAKPRDSRLDGFMYSFGASFIGKWWFLAPVLGLTLLPLIMALDSLFKQRWDLVASAAALGGPFLLASLSIILGKWRFRTRYGRPLTAKNLLAVRSGGRLSPVGD